MVIESFEVPEVPLHVVLGILPLDLLVCEPRIVPLLVFIEVALVVATRGATMGSPITHTDPTELMSTQGARHMVTPLVLLYMPLAAWTSLRICHDPRSVLTLSALFLDPQPCVFTVVGSVICIAALEAESVTAVAGNFFENS